MSTEAVVFCVCLPVLRGRVVCADRLATTSRKMAPTPKSREIGVYLIMIARDCIRERVRFESSDSKVSTDSHSDAGTAAKFA